MADSHHEFDALALELRHIYFHWRQGEFANVDGRSGQTEPQFAKGRPSGRGSRPAQRSYPTIGGIQFLNIKKFINLLIIEIKKV